MAAGKTSVAVLCGLQLMYLYSSVVIITRFIIELIQWNGEGVTEAGSAILWQTGEITALRTFSTQ